MCGIFGIVCKKDKIIENNLLKQYLEDMFILSSRRGKEASGVAINFESNINILKKGLPFYLFIKDKDYNNFLKENLDNLENSNLKTNDYVSIIGHTRLSTNGSGNFDFNNHPIITDNVIGIHNGIITNVEERNGSLKIGDDQNDSKILFDHINSFSKMNSNNFIKSIQTTYKKIKGSASIAFFVKNEPSLFLASNTGSLYLYEDVDSGLFVFFSEEIPLKTFLKKHHHNFKNNNKILQINLKHSVLINLDTLESTSFNLTSETNTNEIFISKKKGKINLFNNKIKLLRCSKCILPRTYPNIKFDKEGVCNYCSNYKESKLNGKLSLEKILKKHRKLNGENDCIVAFSGGRDSSYGLHLLKKEFKMNPISFSYDWGMVTNIARRNQARLTGQLGIEHIIRADNLIRKRRYLRKNIQAWFKRPHLGMVPLFMAGDKFFLDIARELRRELNIPLVIFCAGNELERTDFKGGFAGIRENNHGQRLFSFSISNKIQLAKFYLSQYIRNPSYFNESFFETISSFRSTFISNDDFLYLYQYLQWDEDEINKTLIKEYDWEISNKSNNTWRIGDGYTDFINYVYYTMAGFSEYDTFRSQQIRKGLITREQALYLSNIDNKPNIVLLKEFSNLVGLSFEEITYKINLIPKLY